MGADVGGVELHDLPGLREAHLHLPGPVRPAEGDPEPPGVVQERIDGGVHRGRLPRGGRPERRRARAEVPSRHGLPEFAVGVLGLEEGVVLDGVAPGLGAGPHDDCREVGTAQAGLVRDHLHEVAGVKRLGMLQRRRVAAAGCSRRAHWGQRWWELGGGEGGGGGNWSVLHETTGFLRPGEKLPAVGSASGRPDHCRIPHSGTVTVQLSKICKKLQM